MSINTRLLWYFIGGLAVLSALLIVTAPVQLQTLEQREVALGAVEDINIDTGIITIKSLSNVVTFAAITPQTLFRDGIAYETIEIGDVLRIEGLQATTSLQSMVAANVFPYEYTSADLRRLNLDYLNTEN